jgi:hypothetical protein
MGPWTMEKVITLPVGKLGIRDCHHIKVEGKVVPVLLTEHHTM